MTRTGFWALLITSTTAFGQATSPRIPVTVPATLSADTSVTVRVIPFNGFNQRQPQAWFLNGQRVSSSVVAALEADLIQDLKKVDGVVQLDGVTYDGQVYVTTKNSYTPRLVSLTELKKKYTQLGDKPTLFLIGNRYVTDRYDTYLIDEKSLALLELSTVRNPSEQIDVCVIRLVTKQEQKTQKTGDIRIRGNALSLSN